MDQEKTSRDNRLLSAIDIIIRDTDRKLDECPIDKLADELGYLTSIYDESLLLVRVSSFMKNKSFLMLNQARALKVLHSIVKRTVYGELSSRLLLPHLDDMWAIADVIVINSDLSAMTVFLRICGLLTREDVYRNWLLSKTFEPPIKLVGGEMSNILDLARYYIKICNNYHTRREAENFLKTLIIYYFSFEDADDDEEDEDLYQTTSTTNPKSTAAIINVVEDLTRSCSLSMINILIYIAHYEPCFRQRFFALVKVGDLVQQAFVGLLRRPDCTSSNFNNLLNRISHCLALTNPPMSFRTIVERLESKEKLESIIVYLCNSVEFDQNRENLMLTFCLYPLLQTCICDESKTMVGVLQIDKNHHDLIKKKNSPKLVTLCIAQLERLIQKSSSKLTEYSCAVIFETLGIYVSNHFDNYQHHKPVMQACTILRMALCTQVRNNKDSQMNIIDGILRLLSEMSKLDEQRIPIVLELLKVLVVHTEDLGIKRWRCIIGRIIDLALAFDDHDVMNEFIVLLSMNITVLIEQLKNDSARPIFVKLVWSHMYQNAKDTTNEDLLRNLGNLLRHISEQCGESAIDLMELKGLVQLPDLVEELGRSTPLPDVDPIKESLDTLVEDILNYDLKTDGILDCY